MQLRSVRLRNIRSYESARLELGPGTTLLVGDVGSGKTSLLYAVEMALFGFAVVDPTYLVRHGAVESEVALALEGDGHRYEFTRRFRKKVRRGRAVFEVDEITYSRDGSTVTYSTTEIRQRVIELLGFPDNPNPRARSDLWRWAVYVPQEAMREVLAQEPAERLETVRKALGLEQYKIAAENAALVATDLRHLAEIRQESAGELALFEEKRPLLRARIAEAEGRLERLAAELELRRRELTASEEALGTLEAVRRTLDQHQTEQRELTAQLQRSSEAESRLADRTTSLERERTALQARGRDLAQLSELLIAAAESVRASEAALSEVNALHADLAARARDYAGASAELRGSLEAERVAELELSRATHEVAEARTALDRALQDGPQHEPPAPTKRAVAEIESEVEAARTGYESGLASAAQARHVLRETEELLKAGICPRCRQAVRSEDFESHRQEQATLLEAEERRLTEERARLADLQSERGARERFDRAFLAWTTAERTRATFRERADRAGSRAAEAQDRRSSVQRRHAEVAERESRLRPVTERLAAVERQRTSSDAELKAARSRQEDLQRQVDNSRVAGAQADQIEENLRLVAAEREIGRSERVQAEVRLSESRTAAAQLARRLEEEAPVRLQLQRARESLRTSDLDRARTQVEATAGAAELAEADTAVARRTRLVGEAAEYRRLAAWFTGPFREGVLRLEGRLLARARGEFERHLTRFFSTLVEDPSMIARCDSTFSPLVEIEGELTPAEALSGGERTALALAFRLALGLVVRATGHLALETLILDEPTDGFSPEQVSRMGDLLETLGLPQVILVSHEIQLSAAADRVVRVRKDGGRSTLVAEVRDGPPGTEVVRPSPPAEAVVRAPRTHSARLDAPDRGSPVS